MKNSGFLALTLQKFILNRSYCNICDIRTELGVFLLSILCFLYLQVHHILNEIVMGGMVLETNTAEIITRIEEQSKLEKSEVSVLRQHVKHESGPWSYRN